MEQTAKIGFYEIVADMISKESSCGYDNALEILEYSNPGKKHIAIVRILIEEMSNKGIDIKHIKNACRGITEP